MTDLLAEHPRAAFPLMALASGVFGVMLLVIAWRCRQRPVRALAAAVVATAMFVAGFGLANTHRVNRYTDRLQEQRGQNVASYAVWTVRDGVRHQLHEFRGRPVLLYLWATFCDPCRPSLPVLAQLADNLEGRAAVILLSTEDRETLLRYSERQTIPGIAVYSPEAENPSAPRVPSFLERFPRPTLFLIDANGVVQQIMVGSRSGEHLRKLLEETR